MQKHRGRQGRAVVDAVATCVSSLLLGLALSLVTDATPSARLAAVGVGLIIPTLAARSVLRRRPRTSTAADRVTLLRGIMAGCCATLVVLGLLGDTPLPSWPLFLLALASYLLDGVDGWVARRTSTATLAGGRLDMETDAAFLVVLSVAAVPTIGVWVIAIGAMRYLYWAAAWWRPALRGQLAFSHFRRITAGIQGGVLVGALIPVVPPIVTAVAAALALALLTVSFGKDVVTLERSRWGLGQSVKASSHPARRR